jgi:hypothetical protein
VESQPQTRHPTILTLREAAEGRRSRTEGARFLPQRAECVLGEVAEAKPRTEGAVLANTAISHVASVRGANLSEGCVGLHVPLCL